MLGFHGEPKTAARTEESLHALPEVIGSCSPMTSRFTVDAVQAILPVHVLIHLRGAHAALGRA